MTTIRTEAGMGGRLGRSNMTHWDLGSVVKSQARRARRFNDRSLADQECLDAVAVVEGPVLAAVIEEWAIEWDTTWDVEPECESYADLLADLMDADTLGDDEDESDPWYAPTTDFGDVLDFGNDEEYIVNQGFIVTYNKWYC